MVSQFQALLRLQHLSADHRFTSLRLIRALTVSIEESEGTRLPCSLIYMQKLGLKACVHMRTYVHCVVTRTEVGTRNKGKAVTKQKRGPLRVREGAWSKAERVQTRENYEDTYI